MWWLLFCVFLVFVETEAGSGRYTGDSLCGNITERARACATQILGHSDADIDSCTIEIPYTGKCNKMNFSPIESGVDIGGVRLQPYIWLDTSAGVWVNRTVLNITFTNIKWKTMKFRFQQRKNGLKSSQNEERNHCRNIVLSNDLMVNDQSVLYYDCYWSIPDGNYSGQSHILDFEASDDKNVNRGQYYFNIPSAKVLSPTVKEEEWVPFLYIDILNDRMRLHINPPPPQLNITGYQIKVMKEADKGTNIDKIIILKLKNATKEMTYDYSLLNNGSYHFVVIPLHEKCLIGDKNEKCGGVESPRITITSEVRSLNICIASLTALVVATLFAYYVVVRFIRQYWCKEYGLVLAPGDIPPPTKILVVYPAANRLHAGCVASLVSFLRSEYGFDILFDGDVTSTSHADPRIWAEEALRMATHVMYVVGPAEHASSGGIYDRSLHNLTIDRWVLGQLLVDKMNKSRKEVLNVFFEHSNGIVPNETRRAKEFFLIRDWQKLISHLSMNLVPKQQISRSEKGKNFLEDLAKAKKLLGERDNMLV
ncbi:hypothetical protein O0L34_g5829 [Tuta absoluta]|nr:hypothetical protein O0L34_g5829 [Tuta absoluta]